MDKILYLTYYWPPSGGPGVQRSLKFAKFLPDLKIEPYIVTVNANKASYPIIDTTLEKDVSPELKVFRTNSFEPLEWYRFFTKKKEIPYSGFVNMDKSSLFQIIARFIRGNIFIPDARMGWVNFAYKKALALHKETTFKAIVTSSPPHSTQLTGLRLKRETGLPWVADMRDPWTDIYYYKDFYHLPFAKKRDAEYEKKVLENADAVVVVSESIKNLFISKSDKIDPAKIHVIPNGYDEADFKRKSKRKSKELVITYTGTLADHYPVDEFISALKKVIETHQDIIIKWRIVGKVSDSILEKIKKNNLSKNVDYLGYKKHKEAVSYLLESDALLLIIPDIENNSGILTGKLFEYLAAQKPIVFIGPRNSDAAPMVRECQAGRCFDYNEGMRMMTYLNELVENWKKSHNLDIKNNTYRQYSRQALTKKFAKIIKDL